MLRPMNKRIALPLLLLAAGLIGAAPPTGEAIVSSAPFIAEGVATGPGDSLLVSGVHGRTVLIRRGDRFLPWLRPGRFAPIGGLFGMEVDARRNRLWIAEVGGVDVPGGSGVRSNAILEVEWRSGKLLARHVLPKDDRDRWLGDLALSRDGSIYASDSKGGGLFRLTPGGTLRLIAQTALESPQGLVETADGKALIVADYATGLHHIALADGADRLIEPGKAQLRGIDGLERDGAALVATQNGTVPNRLLRITLTRDETGVTAVDELARGPAGMDDVALGTIVGRNFLFVAHSQWSETGADGQFTSTPAPARIASAPLP